MWFDWKQLSSWVHPTQTRCPAPDAVSSLLTCTRDPDLLGELKEHFSLSLLALGSASGIEMSSASTSCISYFPKKRQFVGIRPFVRKATRTNTFNVPRLMSTLPEGTWVVKTESRWDYFLPPPHPAPCCLTLLLHLEAAAGHWTSMKVPPDGCWPPCKRDWWATLKARASSCLNAFNLFGQLQLSEGNCGMRFGVELWWCGQSCIVYFYFCHVFLSAATA